MAKPATCSVRRSSVRRTWRAVARNGVRTSGLLDACDPLQRRDAFGDGWVGVEELAEEAPVVLFGVVDHHRGHRVVEALRWLVVLGDLLERRDEPLRVAREL